MFEFSVYRPMLKVDVLSFSLKNTWNYLNYEMNIVLKGFFLNQWYGKS